VKLPSKSSVVKTGGADSDKMLRAVGPVPTPRRLAEELKSKLCYSSHLKQE